MSDKKLLPCPFCGGEARFSTEAGNWINCKSCGAETDYFEQREEAINAWNTRVPMERIVERLEDVRVLATQNACLNDVERECYNVYCETCYMDRAIEIVKEEGGLND